MTLSYLINEKGFNSSNITRVMEERNKYSKRGKKRTRLLRRIPLDQLMDLKIDYAFKQLFGNEKNKKITVVFLNAILQKKIGRASCRERVLYSIVMVLLESN